MASLTLKNIKKIYPHSDETKKKKKAKKGEEQKEKKVNLQITEEGVVAVQEFNLEIAEANANAPFLPIYENAREERFFVLGFCAEA